MIPCFEGLVHSSVFKSKSDGIISNLENLISDHKLELKNLYKKINSKSGPIMEPLSLKEIKIHPLFAQSLLLYSNPQYINLALLESGDSKKECKILSALEHNLLKYAFGEIKKILVNYVNKDGKSGTANITKAHFFKLIYKTRCYINKEYNKLFTPKHLKITLGKFDFSPPKTLNSCFDQFNLYKSHELINHFCHIHEVIKRGKKAQSKLLFLDEAEEPRKVSRFRQYKKQLDYYSENINFYNRNFLATLCSNLDSKENFCKPFMQDDIWSKILGGEKPNSLMDFKCSDSLNLTGKISLKTRERCAKLFVKNSNYCTNHGNKRFPSLFPMPKCETINQALKTSRLKNNYHDCPGQIDNESIVNIHRLLTHINQTNVQTNPDSCSSESNLSFFTLNKKYKNNKKWPLEICFFNKATEVEECRPYIPGENKKSKLSENIVIGDILYKTESAKFDIKCSIVSKKRFNPAKLEFKTGCFIIYEKDNCTTYHCPKKVVLDKKNITHLKYKGKLLFEYIPNSITSTNFSTTNIIEKVYKKRSKRIQNLTELKYYLKKKKTGIIHGIGCAEDLIPEHFHKSILNQCRPLPFIIDGITKKDMLVIRSAIDDLHSPKLIHWSFVFGAVASYRNIHPLKSWALYGLY